VVSINQTQSVGSLYNEDPVPFPFANVSYGYNPEVVYESPEICVIDQVKMQQPADDSYTPAQGWDDIYGAGTPNPYY